MNEWLETDPHGMGDDELSARLREFETARIRMDAAELDTIAEWDARMVWAADGATGGGPWLRGHVGMAGSTAREKVRVARALRHMPLVHAAFRAGEITYAKVRLLAGCWNPDTTVEFTRDEQTLLGFARRFGTDDLAKLLAHWKACADPDGASDAAAAHWDRRQVSVARTIGGTGIVRGVMDPESCDIFTRELDSIVAELWRTDHRDHRMEAATTGPVDARPPRSYPQLRHDALVEMARRSAARDIGSATRAKPEIVTMIDYDTLLGATGGTAETGSGAVITGEAARRQACDAGLVRAIVTGRSELLDLGRSTPTPNAAQRRAVALRWDSCFWPGCDRPVNWTQLHHLNPYQRGQPHGGNTNTKLLVPACSGHHHLLHEHRYQAIPDPIEDRIHLHRPDGVHIATIAPNGPTTRRPTQLQPAMAE